MRRRAKKSLGTWWLRHLSTRTATTSSSEQCFYQKHVHDSLPEQVHSVPIQEKDGTAQYVMIDDLLELIALVQVGVLEFHPWGARGDNVEKPDRIVFDLDPAPEVAWPTVVAGAREVRELLKSQGLETFVRTSGGKGLHIVVPLVRRSTWAQVSQFAEAVARALAAERPDKYTANMSKAKRKGKIYVDYLRNQRGATAIASDSTRARPGAPVATPLDWDELSSESLLDKFTVESVPRRLSRLKHDPWQRFFDVRQSLKALQAR